MEPGVLIHSWNPSSWQAEASPGYIVNSGCLGYSTETVRINKETKLLSAESNSVSVLWLMYGFLPEDAGRACCLGGQPAQFMKLLRLPSVAEIPGNQGWLDSPRSSLSSLA